MQSEKARSLQKMPPNNKLAYLKLLVLMVNAEEPINQLKMAEFYRLLSNIRISSSKRELILDFLLEPDTNMETLCNQLLEKVNQQEVNILRFSLIKDLMIIMGADYIEFGKEKELLRSVEEILKITEEQKTFLLEEYQQDQVFYKDKSKKVFMDEVIKETLTKAVALGIPLSVVGFGGLYKGLGPLGILSGLESIGAKKYTKRYSSAVGLGVSILSAFSVYHLMKLGLVHSKRKDYQLINLIREEMELIHLRAIKYLEKDIESLKIYALKTFPGDNSSLINDKTDLLMRTLATLKNTRPRKI